MKDQRILSSTPGNAWWLSRALFHGPGVAAALLALLLPVAAGFLFSREITVAVILTWAGVLLLTSVLRASLLLVQSLLGLRRVARHRRHLSQVFWSRWRRGHSRVHLLGGKSLETSLSTIATLASQRSISQIQGVVMLVGGLVLLVVVQPVLAMATVALTGLCVAAWAVLIRQHHEVKTGLVPGQERAEQIVRAIATLRSLGCEEHALQSWREVIGEEDAGRHRDFIRLHLDHLLPAAVGYLVTLMIFLLAEPLGADTVPVIFSFAAGLAVFIAGVDLLTDSFRFHQMGAQLEQELGLGQPSASPAKGTMTAACPEGALPPRGDIRLHGVSFGYDPASPPLLREIFWEIKPGQQVILTGPPGAGKSALLRLLIGLEQPWSGDIFYDGVNLKDLDVLDLRKHIGFVGQNTPLLPGSLLSNIDPEGRADSSWVWRALQQADLADDIRRLPLGLSSVVTGQNFPAGFRQRLALARAFLRQPRLLFLDEATSSVDRKCQAKILGHLRQLRCTVVMVSQRLSALTDFDCIWVLERGTLSPRQEE